MVLLSDNAVKPKKSSLRAVVETSRRAGMMMSCDAVIV